MKKAPGRTKINFLEQVEIMKAMVDFNKQFSELLVGLCIIPNYFLQSIFAGKCAAGQGELCFRF